MRDENIWSLGEEYEAYAAECESAMRIAMAKILNAKEAIERSGERNPFDSIDSRVKSFESTLGKCEEHGYEPTIENIKERIRDIAGIRIITPFRDDVYMVASLLEHIPGMNIVQKKR